MNRTLSINLGNRQLAGLQFVYSSPLQGHVTITLYRPVDGDFGDLTPPVVPDYAIPQDVTHQHPIDSWAEALAYDQALFHQHLQNHPQPDVVFEDLTWYYARPAALGRYLVLNDEGITTGVIDTETGRARLRSLLDTGNDFEWHLPAGADEYSHLQKLLAEGKIPHANEIRHV